MHVPEQLPRPPEIRAAHVEHGGLELESELGALAADYAALEDAGLWGREFDG